LRLFKGSKRTSGSARGRNPIHIVIRRLGPLRDWAMAIPMEETHNNLVVKTTIVWTNMNVMKKEDWLGREFASWNGSL